MQAIVHSAAVQDRDGGVLLLPTLLGRFPYLEKLFADSAYQGPIFAKRSPNPVSGQDRDRQTIRSGEGLRHAAQALDRRANDRLAQPLPKTGQGLGEPQRHGPHVPSFRLHPPHVAKALQSRMNFRVKLLVLVRKLLSPTIGCDSRKADRSGPPMSTNENRAKYKRDHLRYPSDLTDEEWAHVEPLIPPARRGGRKRETNMREALNALMYVLSTGCQWRYLPKDFPPRGTVYRCFSIGALMACWIGSMTRSTKMSRAGRT